MANWLAVCSVDDLALEDVKGFTHDGTDYAIYRVSEGDFFATAGHCTHEKQLLCEGLVEGEVIECPRHYGRFDLRTGRALGAPVFIDLETYATKVEGQTVYVEVP